MPTELNYHGLKQLCEAQEETIAELKAELRPFRKMYENELSEPGDDISVALAVDLAEAQAKIRKQSDAISAAKYRLMQFVSVNGTDTPIAVHAALTCLEEGSR